MEKRGRSYRGWVAKPEGMRTFVRQKLKLEDNIKMYLQEVEWGYG
jgi:hypothetical protein